MKSGINIGLNTFIRLLLSAIFVGLILVGGFTALTAAALVIGIQKVSDPILDSKSICLLNDHLHILSEKIRIYVAMDHHHRAPYSGRLLLVS